MSDKPTVSSKAISKANLREKLASRRGRVLQFEYQSSTAIRAANFALSRQGVVRENQYVALAWLLDRDGRVLGEPPVTWHASAVFALPFSYVSPGEAHGRSVLRELRSAEPFFGLRVQLVRFDRKAASVIGTFGAMAVSLTPDPIIGSGLVETLGLIGDVKQYG
ncbi:hypothetical protein [Oerskovia sp. Root22]|uniref:hypothetical protein n=1 Tax=Oerskovia sp. Root22 TaxID=1736494 RepID=UPI0012FB36B2|nr:hypothetical protein [Oerskovia sp. Root22]